MPHAYLFNHPINLLREVLLVPHFPGMKTGWKPQVTALESAGTEESFCWHPDAKVFPSSPRPGVQKLIDSNGYGGLKMRQKRLQRGGGDGEQRS